MELWSLLYFLMPQGLVDDEDNGGFANHKEFNEWFSSEHLDLINSSILDELTIVSSQTRWRKRSS
jgi:helicase SWR1